MPPGLALPAQAPQPAARQRAPRQLAPHLAGPALHGAGGAQHVAHRCLRHPGRGGDGGLAHPLPVQLPDLRHRRRRQPGGALRPLRAGDQGRDPAARQVLPPPPQGQRDHPEPGRHLRLPRGLQLPQLHRRQPPRRLVPRVPRERGQPVHPDHAAAVRAVHHASPRRELPGVPGQQRQRQLGQHPGHDPTSVSGSKPFINFCGPAA